MNLFKDRYGFLFWLGWILWFAGSFVLAAALWTVALTAIFGTIQGAELTVSWCVAVFGSWFLLIIPFMRKKERIWKRLNDDQERATDAWFGGMTVFIGLLVSSALFWSVVLRKQIHPDVAGLDPVWAKAVFGTWLAVLLPFLVFMYLKADRIFKDAHARQSYTPRFRSVCVDPSRRTLPSFIQEKIKTAPATLRNGHILTIVLRDGRRVSNIFVINFREIIGIYDKMALDFEPRDVVDAEVVRSADLPAYEEDKWLRLDGRI
jgi:hypothetical protein